MRRLEASLNEGIANNPVTAPRGEKTRMERARSNLDQAKVDKGDAILDHWERTPGTNLDDDPVTAPRMRSAEVRQAAAARRLAEPSAADREGRPVDPPRSQRIRVVRVREVTNRALESRYDRARTGIERAVDQNPLRKVAFATGTLPDDLPGRDPLDPTLGEKYLLHGTSVENAEKIAKGGFDVSFSKNKAPNGGPANYGLLGQGTYFSDVLSKPMTYSACSESLDSGPCVHPSPDPHHTFRGTTMVSKVLLGHPKKMRSWLQAPRRNTLRAKTSSDNKSGRHSRYSRGTATVSNPLDLIARTSSGSNEFAVQNDDQMLPSYIVEWVMEHEDGDR